MAKAVRWSVKQLADYQQRRGTGAPPEDSAPPAAKYRNRKVMVDGVRYDSQKEADRGQVLEAWARSGAITELKRQVPFVLAPAVRLAGEARKKPALRYYADFTYLQDGQLVVEDTKSAATRRLASYRNKRHLMKTVHNIDITEV